MRRKRAGSGLVKHKTDPIANTRGGEVVGWTAAFAELLQLVLAPIGRSLCVAHPRRGDCFHEAFSLAANVALVCTCAE